jgi:hypothetical protein
MIPAVKLTDLTDALDMIPEESGAWLDRETGRVVIVHAEVISAVEKAGDNAVPDLASDWLEDELPDARGICAGGGRYLALPDKFDFHEYRHMEHFIGTVADAMAADQLWRAIKGKGAFRHFKDTAHRLGLLDAWYRHRDAALNRFMLDWATVHQVPVDQTPRRTGPD